MPWIPLAMMANGILEKLNRFIETAFPARHSPVEGLNVAERHIVVGLPQRAFSRLGDAHGFFPLAPLKQKPALEHLHHRRHAHMPERNRQIFSFAGVDQGLSLIHISEPT